MSTQTDTIREALECEYQHLMGAWQMAIGPLTKADIDMRINRNRDALDALSELEAQPSEPRLTVVEAATELLKLHDIKQHVEACNATDCAPDNDKVLYYMERKPQAWDNLRAALSQGKDVLISANYAQVSSSATPKEGEELVRAAQAVVDRWDTPLWKDVPHTGEFIGKLREALSPYTTKAAQP